MNKPHFLILLLIGFFFSDTAGAQDISKDSINNSLPGSYPVKLYYDAIGENAHIYNGYEYFTPDRNIKGSPYYLTDSPFPSNFTYDDGYYQNVPILYDQVRDLVIINRLNQNYKISLLNSKLNGFTLKNHQFVRISKDSARGVELETGFYDRIYTGKSSVFVKRKKYTKEVLEYNTVTNEYLEENTYYVFFEGRYREVSGKSSVLDLFKSKKPELKTYLRKNKLNFKSDFEKTLIATSAYYDQLTG